MIRIFRRFFDFCGENNKRKFTNSIFLGVPKALLEAMKIPAIAVMLHGAQANNLTLGHIALSFGIMLLSVAGIAMGSYLVSITTVSEFTAVMSLMTCCVKIGEELSVAALTRGLGGEVRRTNVCKIGFYV